MIEDEKIKKEKNKELEEVQKPARFFYKLWCSITKIEVYPDMAAEGLPRALTYLVKLIIIWAIILCLGVIYQANEMLKSGSEYLKNEFPEFTYKEGILDVQSQDPFIISERYSVVGQTIIDTKTADDITINKYINSLETTGNGVIILKDRLILKNASVSGTINYDFNQLFTKMGITEFSKGDLINYINSTKIISLYVGIFITVFIYAFITYLTTTLVNTVFLSAFGFFATWIARIKMRYVALFNMSVYALTLSSILNMIYLGINIFVPFEIEYFQVMYVTVAAIYLVAAIFLIKAEFIKKQAELLKIAEAQAIVKRELEEQENEKKQEEEKEKRKQKDKKEEEKSKRQKDQDGDDNIDEPEGSNA